jgi:hypothetical protein
MTNVRRYLISLSLFFAPLLVVAQQAQTVESNETPAHAPEKESKRLLWIVPNYRTAPSIKDFERITPKDKFKIASQDAFDRGTVVLAAMFAGVSQLSNSDRVFGQGAAGYGR